jgi:hypothetical protein
VTRARHGPGGGDDARGGPRHDRADRAIAGEAGSDDAAVSLHHQEIGAKPAARKLARERREIAVEHRLHRGVHRRGDAALVLAVFRNHPVAGGHVGVRPELPRYGRGALFVRGVEVAVQEVDYQRFAAGGEKPAHRGAHTLLVERRHNRAFGVDALDRLAAKLARNQRLEPADEAVRPGPGAAAELEHIAKAARGDEPGARELPLEEGIRGGRGPVHEELEI